MWTSVSELWVCQYAVDSSERRVERGREERRERVGERVGRLKRGRKEGKREKREGERKGRRRRGRRGREGRGRREREENNEKRKRVQEPFHPPSPSSAGLTAQYVGHLGHDSTGQSHPAVQVHVVLGGGGVGGARVVVQTRCQCLREGMERGRVRGSVLSSAHLWVEFSVCSSISPSPTIGQWLLSCLGGKKERSE